MSTTTVIARLRATGTDAILPANRLAVAPAVFNRLCRESEDGGLAGYGAPDAELHILKGDAALDALDDLLRDRAQAAGEFEGRECWTLLPGEGIDGCDVWARATVDAIGADDAATMGASA